MVAKISKKKAELIKEFDMGDGTIIYVYQGDRGENPHLDIRIKYRRAGGRQRTPKHIHWAIDLLIKKEHDEKLTVEFLKFLRSIWDKVGKFDSKDEQKACVLKMVTPAKIQRFESLNRYGSYDVKFMVHLIELMVRMEKTGYRKAHVFKDLLDTMITKPNDIFSIVSKATQVRH